MQSVLASYPLLDTTISLTSAFNQFKLDQKLSNYRDPSVQTIANMTAFIQALSTENLHDIGFYVAKLNMSPYRILDDANVAIYVPKSRIVVPVCILFRFSTQAAPLVIQSPHLGVDNDQRPTFESFLATNCQIMITNAINSHSSSEHIDGPKSPFLSDGAHNPKSLFNQTCQAIYHAYPTDVFWQIHGDGSGPGDVRFLTIVNQNCQQFTQEFPSICQCLAESLTDNFPIEYTNDFFLGTQIFPGLKDGLPYVLTNFELGKCWFRNYNAAPNTSPQARYINEGGPDKGKFMHTELSEQFRDISPESKIRRENLYKSVNEAVVKYLASPLPKP